MFTTEADFGRADWPLLQNGAVSLFWKSEVLTEAKSDLQKLDYEIFEADCTRGLPHFYEDMSMVLNWEEQFGYTPWTGNLNAFNDGLRYYPFGEARRSALVLNGFHMLVTENGEFAHAVLDTIESNARDHLLCGNILLAMVQTDDNQYHCPDLGCRSASWNRREWLTADRGR